MSVRISIPVVDVGAVPSSRQRTFLVSAISITERAPDGTGFNVLTVLSPVIFRIRPLAPMTVLIIQPPRSGPRLRLHL